MRTIIAGSRSIEDYTLVESAVKNCGWTPTTVVSGCARGVDTSGEQWALRNHVRIDSHPAKWAIYGKKAGFMRNVEMSEVADALILIWDGVSKGSMMMLDIARKKGLKVHEVVVRST